MGKFKAGDKVRLRANLIVGREYGNLKFLGTMAKFKFKVLTIKEEKSHYLCGTYYTLEEANKDIFGVKLGFTEEMLEPVEKENNMRKFKIGDKVRIKQEFIDSIKRTRECVENENEIGTIIRIKTYDPNSYCPYTIATVIFKSTGNREQEINISNLELASNFDWEAFKKGHIAVHCDTEEKAKAFLEECEKHGVKKWNGGRKVTDFTGWTIYESITCYCCYDIVEKLGYSPCSFYKSKGIKIIEYPFTDVVEYPEVHITTDGKTTTAVKVLNGKEIARGIARCNPDDKFDFDMGAKLALERLNNPFKPYLEYNGGGDKFNYGTIGTETVQEAPFGEKLYVGDVVEVYDIINKHNCGCYFVISNRRCLKGAIMGVVPLIFKNGISDIFYNFQIRKVKSYKDLKNGENYGGVTAILEEKHDR